MKISAQDLWPLILDFVETYLEEDDVDHLKEYFHLKMNYKVY
jgi:hypothetical protein